MEPHSEEYEAFPADENTEVLAHGFLGGLVGTTVFSFFLAVFVVTSFGVNGGGVELVLVVFLAVVLVLGVYFPAMGGVCFLVGLTVSRLIGHRLDLRFMAVLTACCTVYLPIVLYVNLAADGSMPIETSIIIGLWFSIPMSCAAIGAWVGADRKFQDLKIEPDRSRQFDLKILFSVTLIFAALMFFGTLLKVDASFFIGFIFALIPTSILTALVAWGRAIGKKPTTAPD